MLFRKFIESDLNRCFVRPRCAREESCTPKRIPAETAVLQLPGTTSHSCIPFPQGKSSVRPRCAREQHCIPKRISRGDRGPTIWFKALLRPALIHLVLQTKLLPLLRGTFSIWLRLQAKLEVCLYSPLRTGCYQTSPH